MSEKGWEERGPKAQSKNSDFGTPMIQNTKIDFLVLDTAGWDGVFHAKGWGSKSSFPHSEVCFPWVSREGTRDVPGILPGCPGPLGVFKKFVQQKFVLIFRRLA